jgi:hypothetical protein
MVQVTRRSGLSVIATDRTGSVLDRFSAKQVGVLRW